MATYTGVLVTVAALSTLSSGVSTNLDNFTVPASFDTNAAMTLTASGARSGSGVIIPVTPAAVAGIDPLRSGPDWWERIFVRVVGHAFGLWSRKNLGNILSPVLLTVEVRNGFRTATKTLSAIDVTGGDGVAVTDPFGLPLTYAPLRSRNYTVTVNLLGPPTIDNVVTWDFAGIAEPGLVLTGSRLVPFLFDPDWSEPVEDTVEYLTDVLTSENGTEQRFGLRTLPRRRLRWRVLTLDARETASFDRLVEAFMPYLFGVPLWQNGVRLTAPVAPGATVIPFTTAGREFTVDGLALLMTDPFTYEAVTVTSVAGGQIGVSAVVGSWPANRTKLFPLRFGRLPGEVNPERLTRDTQSAAVEFLLEPV